MAFLRLGVVVTLHGHDAASRLQAALSESRAYLVNESWQRPDGACETPRAIPSCHAFAQVMAARRGARCALRAACDEYKDGLDTATAHARPPPHAKRRPASAAANTRELKRQRDAAPPHPHARVPGPSVGQSVYVCAACGTNVDSTTSRFRHEHGVTDWTDDRDRYYCTACTERAVPYNRLDVPVIQACHMCFVRYPSAAEADYDPCADCRRYFCSPACFAQHLDSEDVWCIGSETDDYDAHDDAAVVECRCATRAVRARYDAGTQTLDDCVQCGATAWCGHCQFCTSCEFASPRCKLCHGCGLCVGEPHCAPLDVCADCSQRFRCRDCDRCGACDPLARCAECPTRPRRLPASVAGTVVYRQDPAPAHPAHAPSRLRGVLVRSRALLLSVFPAEIWSLIAGYAQDLRGVLRHVITCDDESTTLVARSDTMFAAASSSTLRVVDISGAVPRVRSWTTSPSAHGTVRTLAPVDATRFASGHRGGSVCLWDWDAPHGRLAARIQLPADAHVNALATLPDGRFAAATDAGVYVGHMRMPTTPPTRLEGTTGPVRTLCVLSPHRLASGEAMTIRIWDSTEHHMRCVCVVPVHRGTPFALASLHEGRWLVGVDARNIMAWRVDDGGARVDRPIRTAVRIRATALVRLGTDRFATGAHAVSAVRTWRLDVTGHAECTDTLLGTGWRVTALAALADGQVVSSSTDNKFRVWR